MSLSHLVSGTRISSLRTSKNHFSQAEKPDNLFSARNRSRLVKYLKKQRMYHPPSSVQQFVFYRDFYPFLRNRHLICHYLSAGVKYFQNKGTCRKVREDFRKEELNLYPKTKRQKEINSGAEGGI
jgi:hypothetical protein